MFFSSVDKDYVPTKNISFFDDSYVNSIHSLHDDPFCHAYGIDYSSAHFFDSPFISNEDMEFLLLHDRFLDLFFALTPNYEDMNGVVEFGIYGEKGALYGFSDSEESVIRHVRNEDRFTIMGSADNDIMLLFSGTSSVRTLGGDDYIVIKQGSHIIDVGGSVSSRLGEDTYIVLGGDITLTLHPYCGTHRFFIDFDTIGRLSIVLDSFFVLGKTDEARYDHLFSPDDAAGFHRYLSVVGDDLELNFLDGSRFIFEDCRISDLKKVYFTFGDGDMLF